MTSFNLSNGRSELSSLDWNASIHDRVRFRLWLVLTLNASWSNNFVMRSQEILIKKISSWFNLGSWSPILDYSKWPFMYKWVYLFI